MEYETKGIVYKDKGEITISLLLFEYAVALTLYTVDVKLRVDRYFGMGF